MNKITIIIMSFLIVIIGILGYFQYNTSKDFAYYKKNNETIILEYLTDLPLDEFSTKLANKESFYVYVGRPNCGDSQEFETWFPEYIKKYELDKTFEYVNVRPITDKYDLSKPIMLEKYGFEHTPSLVYYENGELSDMVEWTQQTGFTKEMVEGFLQKHNLMK